MSWRKTVEAAEQAFAVGLLRGHADAALVLDACKLAREIDALQGLDEADKQWRKDAIAELTALIEAEVGDRQVVDVVKEELFLGDYPMRGDEAPMHGVGGFSLEETVTLMRQAAEKRRSVKKKNKAAAETTKADTRRDIETRIRPLLRKGERDPKVLWKHYLSTFNPKKKRGLKDYKPKDKRTFDKRLPEILKKWK